MPVLSEVVAVLERTPAAVRELLDGAPEEWTRFSPAPGAWSPVEVVGHLVHGELTDWIPRARIILEHGTARPFDPFDREAMLGRPLDLDAFAAARRKSLDDLAAHALTPADLEREGAHPALGRVTLGELLAAWAVHDLGHLAQITEAMAKRYRTEVGPWRAYLGVLDREDKIGD